MTSSNGYISDTYHFICSSGGKIYSVDFHRTDDLLVTASEDDSVRFYNIANAKLLKTTYHKKHGADGICFTHHPSSVLCSSRYNLVNGESLRYISMYDNRCLRYFKGHNERVVSLCMSPINDSFMSGSLDHSVRIWDLRVHACQTGNHTKLMNRNSLYAKLVKVRMDWCLQHNGKSKGIEFSHRTLSGNNITSSETSKLDKFSKTCT